MILWRYLLLYINMFYEIAIHLFIAFVSQIHNKIRSNSTLRVQISFLAQVLAPYAPVEQVYDCHDK